MHTTPDAGPRTESLETARVVRFLLYLLMALYAVSFTMLGPILPQFIGSYSLRLAEGGLLATAQSIGGILAILVAAVVGDRVRKTRIIAVAALFFSLALLGVGVAPSYGALLGLFLLLGGATKLIDTMTNAYIADTNAESRGSNLSRMHAFFGVGALAGPLYVGLLSHYGAGWRESYVVLAAVCALASVVYTVIALRRARDMATAVAGRTRFLDLLEVLRSGRMWLVVALMFAYAAHQSGLNVWLSMYLQRVLHASALLAGGGLSVFWLGIILGRFAAARLARRVEPEYLLVVGSAVAAPVLAAGIFFQQPILMIASGGIAGFLTGAIIPLLIAIGCTLFPRASALATSMIYLFGSLATMLTPWLMGSVADAVGLRLGILPSALMLAVVFLLSLFLRGHRLQ